MRAYSVPSKSLFFVPFLNFKVFVFSPRHILYSLIGVYLMISAGSGNANAMFGVLGFMIMILAYLPYRFLPFETQLLGFLRFHLRSKKRYGKKARHAKSGFLGVGEEQSVPDMRDAKAVQQQQQDDDDDETQSSAERIRIANLKQPYTITIKTRIRERFIPVTIHVTGMRQDGNDDDDDSNGEILLASTSTDRHGKVSCTVLVDSYGERLFCVKGESGDTLHEQLVEFVK